MKSSEQLQGTGSAGELYYVDSCRSDGVEELQGDRGA